MNHVTAIAQAAITTASTCSPPDFWHMCRETVDFSKDELERQELSERLTAEGCEWVDEAVTRVMVGMMEKVK